MCGVVVLPVLINNIKNYFSVSLKKLAWNLFVLCLFGLCVAVLACVGSRWPRDEKQTDVGGALDL